MAYIDHQIRKLPYNIHRKLAQYLDPPGESDWRALIAAMPEDTYSMVQVDNLERIANLPNGSPTQNILRDMGQKLKTVRQLVSYLDRIHNEEAMLLLRPHEPVTITEQPEPVQEYAGNMAVLHCRASGFPTPVYQWFKNNQPLDHAVDHELRLENLAISDAGIYKCRVSNRMNTEETLSVIVDVPTPVGNAVGAEEEPYEPQTASAKVALVIGNQDYMETEIGEKALQHTVNDSRDLSAILQSQLMQFQVISLANLKKEETEKAIDIFCDMLDEGAYAVFYFAGHGFQTEGRTYMVPVDAQSSWAVNDCVSLDYLLKQVSKKNPKFCLCILDICRKRGDDKPIYKDDDYWPCDLNLVVAYATCPLSEAYERRGDKNGLYMKYLKNYIESDCRVENIFLRAHEDVRNEVAFDKETQKMRPELRTQTARRFCLLDQIEQPVLFPADTTRDELYLSLYKIPRPKIVNFDGDIKVEVGFKHCFGLINSLFIYVHIIDRGQSTNCDASILQTLPKGLIDKFPSNSEEWNLLDEVEPNGQLGVNVVPRSGPFSAASNPAHASLPFRRITQVHNIQRLTNNFSITVRLDLVQQGYNQKKYRPETFLLKDFGIYSHFSK